MNQLERFDTMNEIPLGKRWLRSLGRHEAGNTFAHGGVQLLFW